MVIKICNSELRLDILGFIFRAAYGTESFFSLVCLFSESVAFHWGPKPGLIRYYFQEGNRPNTKSDSLSFGIITPLENAILLRIDSHSNNDYLEFEIVSVLLSCFFHQKSIPFEFFYTKS